jgi:hypothetical protein
MILWIPILLRSKFKLDSLKKYLQTIKSGLNKKLEEQDKKISIFTF